MGASQLLPGLALLAGCISLANAQQDGVPSPGAKREVLVKEVAIDSALDDIVYAGKRHEALLVTTASKRLYFSKDSGQNWQEITNSVDPAPDTELQVERVLVSPADPTVVVLQTKRRDRTALGARSADGKWWPYIYVSEDSGATWRKAWGKHHGLHSWIPHPKNRAWALVSWWSGACESSSKRPTSPEDTGPCVHRLMITRDLGKTLTQIATYVVQFSWGSETVGQANFVYYTAYRSKNGDQSTLSSWTSEVDLHSVRLNGKGRPMGGTEVLRHGNKFLVSREFILVAKVKNELLQTVSLLTSTDGAKTFKVALLPSGMGELEEKWYTVLDTSEGAVVLHVSATEGAAKDTGRIFVSDAEGRRYTQALVDNVRSSSGDCEFDKILGLHGAYMANIVVPPGDGSASAESFRAQRNSAEEEAESEASSDAVNRRHSSGKKKQASKEERIVRTVISFDKGGAWRYLKPPKVDSLGKSYDCAKRPPEECSLHLHGTTSSRELYAPYYSQENAVGIIMGTGNVGSSLRFEPGETNTYLSRDGGLTWVEAHKGAFIYEFGDHGGLIVMADVVKKTREVVFSWNEGQSWFDFKVSEVAFEVDNVLIEPNTTATTFLMYGTREEGVGVLYYMQFDTLKFPPCGGQWAADSVSSDYETWSPSDGVNEEKCLLGQKVTYTRRKRTSQCWNGEEFERPVVKSQCVCTQEDYACDLGFVRAVGSMDCKYGGSDMMPQLFVPRMCTGYWMADAYMKVPGDRCEGGWAPSRVSVPCPWAQPPTSTIWALVATLVIVFGFVAYTRSGAGGKAKGDVTFEVHAAVSRFTQMFDAAKDGGSWMRSLVSRDNGYERVKNSEFEFSTINEEASLSSFIDEAERDEPPPQAISAAASRAPHYDIASDDEGSRHSVVDGGARKATEPVPRLQAPPGASMPVASGAAAVGDSDDGLL